MDPAAALRFDVLDVTSSLGELCIDVRKDFPDFSPVLEKTGIPFIFETEKSSLELAYESGSLLFERGSIRSKEVGALIVVTQSPDQQLPSLACRLQERLALGNHVLAFDINQGCSGFVQALVLAVHLLPSVRHCLIVTVDRYRSKLANGDRSTQSVFSDASASVLVSVGQELEIKYLAHHTDDSSADKLMQPLGEDLRMAGADIFLWTRRVIGPMIREIAQTMVMDELRPTVAFLHQASKLVLDSLSPSLPSDVFVPRNLHRAGNTVSCSIPLLLEEHLHQFRNNTSILCGFGVGLSASAIGVVAGSA